MSQTPEKKFFSFAAGRTYTLVKGKRWYLEYYISVSDVVRIRKRDYGQINRIKDLKAREAAALRLAERLEAEQLAADLPQPETSLLQRTLDGARAHFRYKSYCSYKSRIKYWREWLGAIPDELATVEHARGFLTWQAGRRSNATVRGYQRTLHGLYDRAGILVANNPFHGIKTAAPGSKSLKPFTDAQIKAILKQARENPRLHVAILLLFYCFIRPGEMRCLQIEDIDLERGTIEMRSEISKNKKTQQVAIPDALMPVLKRFIGNRKGLLLAYPDGRPLGKEWLYKAHKKILKALNITGRYSLYSWKHTGVVKAVQAGINLKDLQLQLRHHSLDMVNEYLKDLGVLDSQDLRTRFPSITLSPASR